ncbi:MAG: cytochrome P450 [Pseudomonadota bacterium]
MSGNTWADPSTFIRDPVEAAAVLRLLDLPRIDHYLQALSEQGGIDLRELGQLSANTLTALTGDTHLGVRRVIAPFFGKKSLSCWESTIAEAIDHALDRLEAAQTPDLVTDFTTPLFLEVMPKILGLSAGIGAEHFGAVKTLQRIVEPLLSVATLKQLDAAVRTLIGACPAPATPGSDTGPEAFLDYLNRHREQLPTGLDSRYLVVGFLAGSNSATQSLAFALYGMLTGLRAEWIDAATPGWAERELGRILSLYPSTRTLVRVAAEDTEVAGCPYHRGQVRVIDMVETNTQLRNAQVAGPPHMAFGSGAHKCPGAELSVMLLSRAIPALAKRFPELLLHKEACQFLQTAMMQAPLALPCDTGGGNRRVSNRMCDIREMPTAREIVGDNENFSPPRMEEHLTTLAERSGRDLSTAISFARNAMFFMDGERHVALRLAIADRLGGNRLGVWEQVIDSAITRALDELARQQVPDLAKGFADRLRAEAVSHILGIEPADPARFEELAPGLQDVLAPWLPMRELERVQLIFREALALMHNTPSSASGPLSLLQALLAEPPAGFNEEDLKAVILVLYGATFTLSHTFANILHWILTRPPEERIGADTPAWIDSRLEQVIALCTGPKYIYRMARQHVTVDGLPMQPGDTARLSLLTINRGVGAGHLSFGHGLHRCVGAALSRLLIRRAIPALFSRFPQIALVPQGQIYYPMSQTVALRALPCRLGSTQDKN